MAYLTVAWCAAYGITVLARGPAVLGLLLLVGAVSAAGTVRDSVEPAPRIVQAGLWTATAAAGVGAFGLVMSLVELATTGRVTGPDGRPGWVQLADQSASAAATALLAVTALAWHHRVRGTCPRCGRPHTPGAALAVVHPGPSAPPPLVRWVAYVAAVGLAGYALTKTVLALGGSVAGVSGSALGVYPGVAGWLQAHGVDVTAVLALAGIVLLAALTHRWGHAFPRWLLLAPAWLGAATLAPYGVAMIAALPLVATGVLGSGESYSPWWLLIGGGAFGPFGVALAATAVSFRRRTRPRCVLEETP